MEVVTGNHEYAKMTKHGGDVKTFSRIFFTFNTCGEKLFTPRISIQISIQTCSMILSAYTVASTL